MRSDALLSHVIISSAHACNCRVQTASKKALLIYLFLTQDNPLSEERGGKKDSWRMYAPDPDNNMLNFTFWRPATTCFQSLPKRVSYTLGLWPPIKRRSQKRGPLVTGHQSCGSKSANTPENRKLPSQPELGTTFPHSFHFSSTVM